MDAATRSSKWSSTTPSYLQGGYLKSMTHARSLGGDRRFSGEFIRNVSGVCSNAVEVFCPAICLCASQGWGGAERCRAAVDWHSCETTVHPSTFGIVPTARVEHHEA